MRPCAPGSPGRWRTIEKGRQPWKPVHVRPPNYTGRYALKNQLNAEQAAQFAAIVATYAPDLHDPAAVEVLLVLREVCTVLDFPPAELDQLFGARLLAALATWGDIVVGPNHHPLPGDRAWVWRPNHPNPRPYRIDRRGFIYVGVDEPA